MRRFLSFTESGAAVFLLLIALVTSGNVLLRNVFNQSIPDWFDLCRLLLGIAMFWGISIATYRSGHICVDAVWEMMNEANRRRIDVLASLLTLAFLAPLAWMVWVKVLSTGTQATSDLQLPMMWFYAVAAVGAVMAALLAVLRAVEVARDHDPRKDLPDPEDLDHVAGAGHGS